MFFRFQNQVIYERASLFVKDIYSLTGRLPSYEQPGLIPKLRDLSARILEELAEGSTHTPNSSEADSLDKCIVIVSKIASLLDLCLQLDYLDKSTHKHWLTVCEELTKRFYESRKSLK